MARLSLAWAAIRALPRLAPKSYRASALPKTHQRRSALVSKPVACPQISGDLPKVVAASAFCSSDWQSGVASDNYLLNQRCVCGTRRGGNVWDIRRGSFGALRSRQWIGVDRRAAGAGSGRASALGALGMRYAAPVAPGRGTILPLAFGNGAGLGARGGGAGFAYGFGLWCTVRALFGGGTRRFARDVLCRGPLTRLWAFSCRCPFGRCFMIARVNGGFIGHRRDVLSKRHWPFDGLSGQRIGVDLLRVRWSRGHDTQEL